MSNTLTALEERGWIERQRSTEDRRQVYIHLTPQGQRALAERKEDMEAHIAELTVGLDAEARQKLLNGLDVLETVFMSALMNITSSEREVEMHTRKIRMK
jgi:DNA-binding MarR family transcriptional regulator